MAITKTVDFKGISIVDAYVKISSSIITRNSDNEFICRVNFAEKANHDALEFFESYTYDFPFDLLGANPLVQGYTFMKTLPRYIGAVDV
jgi:hypothetical protein